MTLHAHHHSGFRWRAAMSLVAGVVVWCVWPRDLSVSPVGTGALIRPVKIVDQAGSPERSGLAPTFTLPDPDASRLGRLQLQALELMADYEARRDADDPVGADAIRLRFEALLTDATASDFVQTLPAAFLESFFGDLALRRWAKLDRAAAAAWMAKHPSASPIPAAALAHGWLNTDPEGLNAYLDNLPASTWKNLVAKSAGEEALVADLPMATIGLLNKTAGDDPRRDELYEWAVTKWAISDPSSAAAWAAQADDPARAEKLLAAVAVGYANAAPAEAARWAVETIGNPETFRSVLPSLVRLWAAKDSAAAARWVDAFPAGPVKNEAVEGLLSIWAFADLTRAQAWSNELTDTTTREHARTVIARLAIEVGGSGGAR